MIAVIVDLAKQLQALVTGGIPLFAASRLFPFLNPQIINDLWTITIVLAVAASALTFNLAQRFQKPRVARSMAVIGLFAALLSLIILQALVGRSFFADEPGLQDLTARAMFIIFFVGVASTLGYSSTYVLK
jgi:hypothetical protein